MFQTLNTHTPLQRSFLAGIPTNTDVVPQDKRACPSVIRVHFCPLVLWPRMSVLAVFMLGLYVPVLKIVRRGSL